MELVLEHSAGADQMRARKELVRLYETCPLNVEDRLFNLGLYARSGLLVKFLVMYELYKRFLNVPGMLVEAGCWYGQNLVLMRNLQAILEPFHQRKIVAFDSFRGYPGRGDGWYSTGPEYKARLDALLDCHKAMNVQGHIASGHELIEGDINETAPHYFADRPESVVAFAYVDLGPERPTEAFLRSIKPHLVPGSIILLDELTLEGTPGEAIAFKRVFSRNEYKIERCALYNSKSIVEIR